MHRKLSPLRFPLAAIALAWAAPAAGQTYRYQFSWNTNAAANWNTGSVWNNDTLMTVGTGPPTSVDKARFSRNATHQVNFTQNQTVSEIDIVNDNVTFDLNGFTLSLTGTGVDSIVDTQALVVSPTSATGRLTVLDGDIESQGLVIGGAAGLTAEVVVGAGGSLQTQSNVPGFGYLLIGRKNNSGTLRIQNGGDVSTEFVALATNDQGTPGPTSATVLVDGAGSTWTSGMGPLPELADYIGFANSSTATVQVLNGGVASLYQPQFGYGDTATGIGLISGAGSELRSQLSTIIGAFGSGQVTVELGGRLETEATGSVLLGVRSDSSPFGAGSGTLTVRSGGSVETRAVVVGNDLGFTGTMSVEGVGTVVTQNSASRTVSVGEGGNGTLNVAAGGVINAAGSGQVGRFSGSSGQMTISGAGSAVHFAGGPLDVGSDGVGVVQVTSGGWLTSLGGTLGGFESTVGGSSNVIVSGANSRWDSGDAALIVGRNDAASLQVLAGGKLTNSSETVLGFVPGNSNGSLTVSGVGSTFNADFVGIGGNLNFGATGGMGLLTVSSNAVATSESVVLVRDRLTLSTGGSMTVGPGAAASPTLAANTLTLRAGGVLAGNGTVSAIVSNQAGAVTPLGPELQLAISGAFVQGAAGTTAMTLFNPGIAGLNYAQIAVNGSATFDGTLELVVDLDYQPEFGDSFSIFTYATGAGHFDEIVGRELEGLGPGGVDLVFAHLRQVGDYDLFVTLPGDANLDGEVSGADFTLWADNFGDSDRDFSQGDFTGDGLVTGADFTVWGDYFGESALPPAAPSAGLLPASPGDGLGRLSAVPEPSAAALLAIGAGCGLAGLLARRRGLGFRR